MPGNQNAPIFDEMDDCVGSNRYESKYNVYKEDSKRSSRKLFGTVDCLPYSNAPERIGLCSKRKALGEDTMLCSVMQLPSLKRMAVSGSTISPSGMTHVSGICVSRLLETYETRFRLLEAGLSTQNSMYCNSFVEWMLQTCLEIHSFDNSAEGNLCAVEHISDVKSLNQSFLLREEQLWAEKKQRGSFEGIMEIFFELLWSSFIPYPTVVLRSVSLASPSCKATAQRFMDCDAIDFEGKEEEVDKDKEALERTSEEKDSKKDNTRPAKESNGKDKGEACKENEEDEGKELGEERGEEDGEGEEEDKDGEQEKEAEEMEEEEEQEEEGKEEDVSEVNSALCTVSLPPVEQTCDHGTVSDCRSEQSDDMYYGQEGISSWQVGGQCSHSTAAYSKHSMSRRVSVNQVTDVASTLSHFPMSARSTSCCMQHESHCLQLIPVDASGQSSPDKSRDMYPDELHYNMQQASSHGSPCLQPVAHIAGWQTSSDVSKDMYTDGSVSYNWQETPQATPPMYPIASVTAQQTSSDASRDRASPNKVAQPGIKLRIKFPGEEITNVDVASAIEDGSGEEVLSNVKDVRATTAKALLSSGLLDGCRVHYHYKGSGSILTGLIQDGGILCDCRLCRGKVVVNVSSFEKHAGSNARHPSDYIFLENGKSLQEYIKAGSQCSQAKTTGVVRKATIKENSERSSCRIGSTRSVSAHLKRNSFPSAESTKTDFISFRSAQKLQASQTRDGSRHKLLFQPGGLPDGTEVAYYVKGQCYLRGTKKGHGICCGCCNEVISCSQFEAHAGWASRRNAYISMYLSNGQSLHEFALALSAKDQNMTDTSTKENDDFCAECGDGGDLVLCDTCPKAFHAECIGLTSIPEGDWCCRLCEDQRQHPWRKTTREGGRVHSLSNKEKNVKRCQRVVKASGNMIGGCVFCKNGDFLKSGFGPKTIMLCDQCEREYHVGCMKEKGVADLQELPEGLWFCCVDCNHIHDVLEGFVTSGPEPVTFGSVPGEQQQGVSSEITWQLLHGRRGNPQNGRILSEAASIFTESFDPIVDATSGRDLISLMVHSRSIRDQDFQGMYCAVLRRKEEVVSAAVLRVFGQKFAEMPLVATASASRGQGYFQMLMSCIESLLHALKVKYLILPAAEGAEGIWTKKFGFSKLHEGQLQEFGSEVQIMIFQGSSILMKVIL